MNDNTEDTAEGFWTCNIDRRGRLIRLMIGLLCLGASAWLWWGFTNAFWSTGLLAMGLVSVFESIRGWCVMRALGAQTPF